MGRLRFLRAKGDAVTDVSLHLDQLIAETPEHPAATARLHLVSVFGGDVEAAAVIAAAHEGLRFEVQTPGVNQFGVLGEDPTIYRSSIQVPGRKRPVRHVMLLSREFVETTLGASGAARRTVLFDESPDFVLHRLAVRFGLPVLPDWADWFTAELRRRNLIEELTGFNCSPIAVKGTKLRMLRILSAGLRRRAISIPIAATHGNASHQSHIAI